MAIEADRPIEWPEIFDWIEIRVARKWFRAQVQSREFHKEKLIALGCVDEHGAHFTIKSRRNWRKLPIATDSIV